MRKHTVASPHTRRARRCASVACVQHPSRPLPRPMADAAPAPAPARPAEPAPGEPTPLSDVWAKDCRVRHVTVLGASRTKDYVVLREIEPVRAQAALLRTDTGLLTWSAERAATCLLRVQVVHARTLEEVKDALLEASARLHALGIFRGVDILADKSETVRLLVFALELGLMPGVLTPTPDAALVQGGPHTSDLTVTVKEKSVVSANTGTYVQVRRSQATLGLKSLSTPHPHSATLAWPVHLLTGRRGQRGGHSAAEQPAGARGDGRGGGCCRVPAQQHAGRHGRGAAAVGHSGAGGAAAGADDTVVPAALVVHGAGGCTEQEHSPASTKCRSLTRFLCVSPSLRLTSCVA